MKQLFGKRLRELRTLRGLTQEHMAELIGINPENYCRIEKGLSFPKPENIKRISEILDVEISKLFEFEHFENYEIIFASIIEKLKNDKETTILTYKFLKSINKII